MYKLLKPFALILISCILLLSFAGCQQLAPSNSTKLGDDSKENNTDTEAKSVKEKEPFELTIMKEEYSQYPIKTEEQKVFEWVYEKTGVKLIMQTVPASNYDEKKNALLATNNLPDVIKISQADANDYGRKGAFTDLTPYLENKLPNLIKATQNVDGFKKIFVDNKLYYFPMVNYDFVPDGMPPAIRTDLINKLNLEIPKTYEELYNVLKELKKVYPESYPWTSNGSSLLSPVAFGFGAFAGLGYDPDLEKYVYGWAMSEGKESVSYLNRLFAEGILDPDFPVNTKETYREKLGTEQSFFYFDNMNFTDEYNSIVKSVNPEAIFEAIPFFENSKGKVRPFIFDPQWALGNGFAVSAKAKNIDRIIEFMDWMYSEEGSNTTNFGKEGETYILVDGKPEFTDNVINRGDKGKSDTYKEVTLGLTLNVLAIHISQRQWHANAPDYKNSIGYKRSTMLLESPGFVFQSNTLPPFTKEETDKIKTIKTSIDTKAEQEILRFITGARPMSEYDSFIDSLRADGLDELVKIYNDALERLN